MAKITIAYGLLLVVLAVAGYLITGAQSPTALIPAAIGLPVFFCGLAAKNPARRKLVMHIAVVIALLGFLGSAGGIVAVGKLAAGQEVARPAAAISRSIMALLSAVFLTLAIRSFVAARKQPTVTGAS